MMNLNLSKKPTGDESIIITPTPHFVIKSLCIGLSGPAAASKQSSNSSEIIKDEDLYIPRTFTIGHKVYINLCSHSAMPPVRKAIAESGKTSDESAVNVPLAVGPVKHDTDKSGEPCCVVDMVMHPDVAQDCEKDRTGAFRHWLVQLASQYMDKKHGLDLSPQYRLPKMLYKGSTVTQQRIRKPAGGAGIRELSSNVEPITTSSNNSVINSQANVVAPMAILSEAGALPVETLANTSASTTASNIGSSLKNHSVSSRMSGGSGKIPMDIRLVNSNSEDGIKADIIEEVMFKEKQLKSLDSNGSIISPMSSNSSASFGLTALATKRAPLNPIVSVSVSLLSNDGDKSSLSVVSCECIPESGAVSVKGNQLDDNYFLRAELPSQTTINSGITGVSVSITFPERPPSTNSGVNEPLLSNSISAEITSSGDIFIVSAPDDRRVSIRLPAVCQTVGLSSTSTFDAGFRLLSTTLPVQSGRSVLPPLPSSLSDMDAGDLRALLERYVEADLAISSPDPGSKPWLVAQALASDEVGESKAEIDAKKQVLETQNSENNDDSRLPEDAFLEADALSTHYLRQREEDKKRQIEKEMLKEKERKESGLPESTLQDLVQKVEPKVAEAIPKVDDVALLTDLL
jgi:hypothetical protein